MSLTHISTEEVARDFASILARVRAGEEFLIEDERATPVLMRAAEQPKGRLLSESLKLAEEHARKRGYDVATNADFAADMEARIRQRGPLDTSV